MSASREMISVGIDFGSTTTQVIFSGPGLVDFARAGQIPRVDNPSRKMLYESEIVFTPPLVAQTIGPKRMAEIQHGEYLHAGITPLQLKTSAAIITIETARKMNADEVLRAAASLAGDFIFTFPGPNGERLHCCQQHPGLADAGWDVFYNINDGGGTNPLGA